MHILVATDADSIVDDITAALGGPDIVVHGLPQRSRRVRRRGERTPDLVVLDLQIGSMGGMAVTMALRLDESSGTLPHVPVLMLLDRQADIHLAKRCAADGWLVKPLDPLTPASGRRGQSSHRHQSTADADAGRMRKRLRKNPPPPDRLLAHLRGVAQLG